MSRKLAWFLGWFASDGHLQLPKRSKDVPTITFCLHAKDRDVLDKFQSWLNTNSKVREYNYNGKRTAHYSIFDKELISLVDGVKNAIPVDLIEGFEWDFLRGVFEGDGCFYIRPKNSALSTMWYGNKTHLVWLASFVGEYLGLDPKKPKDYGSGTHSVRYEGRPARMLGWKLYRDAPQDMSLDRKKKIILDYIGQKDMDSLDTFLEVLGTTKTEVRKKGTCFNVRGSSKLTNLDACKMGVKLLKEEFDVNAAIPLVGRGNSKVYHLYIPSSAFERYASAS
jgi:hypothetical protein